MGEGRLSRAKDLLLLEGSVGSLKPQKGSVIKGSGIGHYVATEASPPCAEAGGTELEASLSYVPRPCLKTKQPNISNKQELGAGVEMAKLGWGCYTVEKY